MKKLILLTLIIFTTFLCIACSENKGQSANNNNSDTPSTPSTPSDQNTPENPSTPTKPSEPENPSTPTEPSEPENPSIPTEPSEPENPSAPEETAPTPIGPQNTNNLPEGNASLQACDPASGECTELVCEKFIETEEPNKGYNPFNVSGFSVSCFLLISSNDDSVFFDDENAPYPVSNVKWVIDRVENTDPKFDDTWIDLNFTDTKTGAGPHTIEVNFELNGKFFYFKTEATNLEYVPAKPESGFPQSIYNGIFSDLGLTPATSANKDIPMLAYFYDTSNPKYASKVWNKNKTYAFIRVIAESSKPDFQCQSIGSSKACPRDISFQLREGTDSAYYVTFRGDYLANDYNYNRFKDNATYSIKIPVGTNEYDNTLYFSDERGFQYDNGKKMNFPFYFGDPSFELSGNIFNLFHMAISNESYTYFMGHPNYGRTGNIRFEANPAGKGDNNIALFTMKWKDYTDKYTYEVTFDGWAKLP